MKIPLFPVTDVEFWGHVRKSVYGISKTIIQDGYK